jgi:prepilin-type N-terminal cleavage/methylation domain-containing protein
VENKSSNVSRRGFTAIEMMVVVSIVIILVAMVVPTIGPAMRKGAVHDSANAIQRACSQARQLARSNSEPDGVRIPLKWYGVSVVVPNDGKAAYAVVIYGGAANDPSTYTFASDQSNQYPNGTPLLDGTTGTYSGYKPAAKFALNRNVMPFKDATVPTPPALPAYTFMAPGAAIGWYYQYRTGFVFMNPAIPGVGIDIGVPVVAPATTTAPQSFGVASLDKKYVVAIAVYKIGLLNSQDAN